MITGEIKVNEYLTLLKWEATNEGKCPLNPGYILYTVRVNGIYSGHQPYTDEFQIRHRRSSNHLALVVEIHQEIANRSQAGLTRRPVVD